MSDKKDSKIRRPGESVNPPEVLSYNPETFEPIKVDKKKALREWLNSTKSQVSEGDNQVSINPKQAAYSKKRKKK